jgi:hypothetical protein
VNKMKRSPILFSLTALVALAIPVFAATKPAPLPKFPFYEVTGGNSDFVTDTAVEGFVKIGKPGNSGNLLISGEITLLPNTEYFVWVRDLTNYTGPYLYKYDPLGYFKLVSFTTDGTGKGYFEYSIDKSYLPDGAYPIQVAINYAPSDPIGYTVVATKISATTVTIGPSTSFVGCNKPGTTFVGMVENPGDPTGPQWRLVMHGSYVLGKCGGTGPSEGDWNVQMAKGPDGQWEYYKNVFTHDDLTDLGAFLYMDMADYAYHPKFTEGNFYWWIIKSNGVSDFMEPSVGGFYQPAHATPNGFGFYK